MVLLESVPLERYSLILFLFTSSYPYDFATEHTFIQPEIHHLREMFERVILVPRMCKGNRLPLPSGITVIGDYADFLQEGSTPLDMMRASISSKCFSHEIRRQPAVLLHPAKVAKLILFSARAEITGRWVRTFLESQQIQPNNCLFYTYWFDHVPAGLAMLKPEFPAMRLVSRAHGYDIYEEYYFPYYWPCRPQTLEALDVLFFASEAGKTYYRERYPEFMRKYETAHLGIPDPGFTSRPSRDGVFRIVSCAHIVPVKRLDLLLEGIAAMGRLRPEQRFEWVHFGDGTNRKTLEKRAAREFPSNVQGRLPGNVANAEVMQHYREHPVDVFVNVSSTEGGAPVAIQEAISCGIPVVATAVGGNPEVVTDKTGILLRPDPEPQEIAAAFLEIRDDPKRAAQMRVESRQLWQRSYNAEVNFRAFAERLKTIGES